VSKVPYFIALALAVVVILLSRYPPFWLPIPTLFQDRFDAQQMELQADYYRGLGPPLDIPTQAHRLVVPYLLAHVPGVDYQEKWWKIVIVSLLAVGISAWYIGMAFRPGDWRVGALSASVILSGVGWYIGLLPWHIDTVVAALEFACLAAILWRKWWAVAILLCIGMATKETFVFFTLGVFIWLLIMKYQEWRDMVPSTNLD